MTTEQFKQLIEILTKINSNLERISNSCSDDGYIRLFGDR